MIESVPAVEISAEPQAANPALEVLFDGECPLCSREVRWLQSRSAPPQLLFTDISATDFDPACTGRSLEELMGSLHARTARGEWLTGTAALRGMYRAAGFRKLAAITEWPVLNRIVDLAYRAFAIVRPYLRKSARDSDLCQDHCGPRTTDG